MPGMDIQLGCNIGLEVGSGRWEWIFGMGFDVFREIMSRVVTCGTKPRQVAAQFGSEREHCCLVNMCTRLWRAPALARASMQYVFVMPLKIKVHFL